jgi:hypothetical protein
VHQRGPPQKNAPPDSLRPDERVSRVAFYAVLTRTKNGNRPFRSSSLAVIREGCVGLIGRELSPYVRPPIVGEKELLVAKDHAERVTEANNRGQADASRGISPRPTPGPLDHPDIYDAYMEGYKNTEGQKKDD